MDQVFALCEQDLEKEKDVFWEFTTTTNNNIPWLSPPPRRGSQVNSDNTHTHTVIKIHPLTHILDTWALIFCSCPLLFIPTASLPSPCDNHPSKGGHARNSFSYKCTRALHSFRSFAHCLEASTVIPLLPKATFTPSISSLTSVSLVPSLGRLRNWKMHMLRFIDMLRSRC